MTMPLARTAAALALAGGIAAFTTPASACNGIGDGIIGEICVVAFDFCPRGYVKADGRLLPVVNFQALYALLGTNYGGDGRVTFGLPDLRGRIPVATGGSAYMGQMELALGQRAGSPTVTLTADNLPQHTHAATFIPTVNTMSVDVAQVPEPAVKTPVFTKDDRTIHVAAGAAQPDSVPPGTIVTGGTVTVSPNPSPNTPVSIQPPVLGLTYCISYQGVWPSRD